MLDHLRRGAEAFFLGAMAVLALTCAAVLFWAVWPEKWRGEGAASWFQAIGAIVGIGIAIYVPWRQRITLEQERKSDAMKHRLIVVRRLVLVAADFLLACTAFRDEALFPAIGVSKKIVNLRSLQLVIESARALEAIDRENDATSLLFAIRSQANEMILKVERRDMHELSLIDLPLLSENWWSSAAALRNAAIDIQAEINGQAGALGVEA